MAAFLAASLVLALTPGPVVVYVLARTVAEGRRAGLASVLGAALGNLGNAVGASLGLAALLAVSSAAFLAVKLAGAAYLVYLGIAALRQRGGTTQLPSLRPKSAARLMRDGFMVALLNPKTAIFFAAFLPQFVDPAGPAALQCLALSVVFVLLAASTDTAYVLTASAASARIGATLERGRSLGRYAVAATFIGLGVFTAASGSRSAR